ncbi:MAG: hypothetical protein U9Q79_09045, partial [Candidatus Hydrogenedentes bacterium]|nr:hypothetical protein [Candidatus Hydrogenedentota bacterium]
CRTNPRQQQGKALGAAKHQLLGARHATGKICQRNCERSKTNPQRKCLVLAAPSASSAFLGDLCAELALGTPRNTIFL